MWYVILRRRRRTEEEEDEEEEADSRLLQRPDVRAEGSTLPRAHLEVRVTHAARHASGGHRGRGAPRSWVPPGDRPFDFEPPGVREVPKQPCASTAGTGSAATARCALWHTYASGRPSRRARSSERRLLEFRGGLSGASRPSTATTQVVNATTQVAGGWSGAAGGFATAAAAASVSRGLRGPAPDAHHRVGRHCWSSALGCAAGARCRGAHPRVRRHCWSSALGCAAGARCRGAHPWVLRHCWSSALVRHCWSSALLCAAGARRWGALLELARQKK